MKNSLFSLGLTALVAAALSGSAYAGSGNSQSAHATPAKNKQSTTATVALSGHAYSPGFVYHGGYYGAHKR
jgi:hypothetical protein